MRDSKLTVTVEDPRELSFHPWYGLATLAYMAGITLLSSVPRQDAGRHVILEVGLNLGHIPLFAGLTFLLVKAVAPRRRGLSTASCVWIALLLSAFAALDEWHQAFVPGRSSSPLDLLLDVMGIGAVLLFFRLSALASEEP